MHKLLLFTTVFFLLLLPQKQSWALNIDDSLWQKIEQKPNQGYAGGSLKQVGQGSEVFQSQQQIAQKVLTNLAMSIIINSKDGNLTRAELDRLSGEVEVHSPRSANTSSTLAILNDKSLKVPLYSPMSGIIAKVKPDGKTILMVISVSLRESSQKPVCAKTSQDWEMSGSGVQSKSQICFGDNVDCTQGGAPARVCIACNVPIPSLQNAKIDCSAFYENFPYFVNRG